MKLSIITINFNNRDGLQRTINSVLSQSFKDFEWIVIDGGSTDGSRNLLEIYKNIFLIGVANQIRAFTMHKIREYLWQKVSI